MGAPVARNLARSGFTVTAWNRTADKVAALVASGVVAATDPRACVADADLTIVLLSDGPTTSQALFDKDVGIARSLSAGATVAMMSSIHPATAAVQARQLADLGVDYLDAPVSGGECGAINRQLTIFAGGAVDTVERVRPALETLGRLSRVGDVGAGQLVKLANQMIVGVTIEAVAEALLLIERGGGDPAAAFAALEGGFADSTVLRQHGARMLRGDHVPGATIATQLKDLRMAVAQADQQYLGLPVLRAAEAMFAAAAAGDDRALDHSAVLRTLRARQGRHVAENQV